MKKMFLFVSASFVLLLSSCSYSLLQYSVVTTKQPKRLDLERPSNKTVVGKSFGFLALGATIKGATDDALFNAGPGYDILIDGEIIYKSYPFWGGYIVKGVAVKSAEVECKTP